MRSLFSPIRRSYVILFLLGLAVPLLIAQYQPIPGYLDSDYYFAGGIQLATGKGFTEPYLWNYLDGTTSLPHPSHSYWMPLASIVAALGMWLTGETTYASGRLFFILIAAFVPPVTAALAYTFSRRNDLAFTSGVLAIFCVYNAPFMGVTDNFGLFMLLGGLYFLVVTQLLALRSSTTETTGITEENLLKPSADSAVNAFDLHENQLIENPTQMRKWLLLGVLSGLLNLSRTDGLLWLGITLLFALSHSRIANYQSRNLYPVIRNLVLALIGFLLVMSPWYIRNWNIYGTLMAPGGSRALWLGDYDQTFAYPPSHLSFDSFLALGWDKILADRLSAFGTNLLSGFAAHGGIVPFPFIIAGIIYYRKDGRVKLAGLAWVILLLVMSFLFPFAGKRGAFFHAGAALQPMWWTLAPLGLESILVSLKQRGIGNDNNRMVFRSILVLITLILTVYVVNIRLFTLGWGSGEDKYPTVERFLLENGIKSNDIVIVGNAPGYYISTGRPAISIPYGGEDAIRAVSTQFKAYYVVFENANSNPNEKYDQFIYLGEVNGAYIYKIEP
jgi:hypothetical protein